MSRQRNLAWKINWYRQSELEGALLLGRLIRQADTPLLVCELTRHCADEARHAWLWERTRVRLGLPLVRIFRSYQSFYLDEIEAPRSIPEVLALTNVFEQRVDRLFTEELDAPDQPKEMRATLRALLHDEQRHLDWIARWLAGRAEGQTLLEHYRRADEAVYRRLHPYRDHVWDVPGLGRESFVRVAPRGCPNRAEAFHG